MLPTEHTHSHYASVPFRKKGNVTHAEDACMLRRFACLSQICRLQRPLYQLKPRQDEISIPRAVINAIVGRIQYRYSSHLDNDISKSVHATSISHIDDNRGFPYPLASNDTHTCLR